VIDAASWPRVGLLVLACAGCMYFLTSAEARIRQRSGGLGVPDLLCGFTADELFARLDAYGDVSGLLALAVVTLRAQRPAPRVDVTSPRAARRSCSRATSRSRSRPAREAPHASDVIVVDTSAAQAQNTHCDPSRNCRASARDAGSLRSFVYLSDGLDYPAHLP
jgi:hypothetical protein